MKKEQRQPYLDLIKMMPEGYGLCNFCKFAAWDGYSACESDLICKHPLKVISEYEHTYNTWSGGDCWGFRPNESLQQIGVAVSIILSGLNAHKSVSQGEYIAIIPSKYDISEGVTGCFV